MTVTLTDAQERGTDTSYYYALGIGFLALAKIKYWMDGYTPKPISSTEIDQCIDYDIHIAEKYLAGLNRRGISIEGKDVLELGPGSDLGLGAYLLWKGAKSYTAFDLHANAGKGSVRLYNRMRERGIEFDRARLELKVCREFSLLKSLEPNSADIVVSNGSFEHFDDPARVLRELTYIVRPGGVLQASVDLETHSRWIKKRDPHNIYRYPDWLYRLFYFPGQPNRIRTGEYRTFLEESGWQDIDMRPNTDSVRKCTARVHRRFRDCDDLDVLAFSMFAKNLGPRLRIAGRA